MLQFCNSTKAEVVSVWAENLPAIRIAQTSALLYQALPEINKLQTSADNRLAMLESLRPYVQQCIQGLTKSFLNKPLILPEGAMKTAVVALALQKHLNYGYILAAIPKLLKPEKSRNANNNQQLALCLHRAITGLGLQLLRSYQLYTQAPAHLWLECHTLYLLAETTQLLKYKVSDQPHEEHPQTSIEQAYMQVLLLSCANANQLTQVDIEILYRALEDWSKLAHLTPATNHLFSVNLRSNIPPNYTKRFTNNDDDADIRGLNTSQLIYEVEQLRNTGQSSQISRLPLMNTHLLNHIIRVWGRTHERGNQRQPAQGNLDTLVGLSAIHYYLCNQQSFDTFVYGQHQTRRAPEYRATTLSSEDDPWAKTIDAEAISQAWARKKQAEQPEPVDTISPYTIYQVERLDVSPGGYCLQWRNEIPSQVKAGELLALREPGGRCWSIAVVRWTKQHKGTSQIGVQLLAPQAEPYAAQVMSKTGANGEFMRALLLPELTKIKQPATLLTSGLPFNAQQKVNLRRDGNTSAAFLTECVFSTSAISQFNFRKLDTVTTTARPLDGPLSLSDDFSTSWD